MVGQAFSFNGINSYVEVPDSTALRLTNELTIEFWVKRQQLVTEDYLVNKGGDWTDGQLNYGVTIPGANFSAASNSLSFNFAGGTRHSSVIADFNWHHCAIVARNGDVDPTFYIDGVQQPVVLREGAGTLNLYDSTNPLQIGAQVGSPSYFSTALLDELSLYNRALSSNEIAAIYDAGSAGKCAPMAPSVPVIGSFSPLSGTNGTVVTISGTNFGVNPTDNVVYFGAVTATVLSASLTNLVVTVPVGATYAPITETVNGLVAYSGQLFEPTFPGNGAGISATSFGPRLDLPSGNGPIKVVIADLDGDGKPDLIVANDYNNTISLYRNISTNGTLTTNSFAPRVDLATPPGQYSPYGLVVADVDGDGKPDIIVSDNNNSIVSVYRNTCTPGNISSNLFATRVDFATGNLPQGVEVRDIDGDGRPDILVANTGDGTVSILRNTGTVGSLTTNSFAPRIDIITGSGCDSVVVGDLDGDGKPDVVTANSGSGTLTLLHNTSSPGSISFDPKADIAVMSGLVQMAIGDLDGDGKPDLAVTSYLPSTLSVLRNISTVGSLTTNSFAPRVDYPLGGRGHSPIMADLNGDGKPDLAVVTELSSLLSIFQNNSTPGSFTNSSLAPRVDFATGWNAWGVAAGDLDGDGRPDIIFCNSYDNTISIYQNQSPFSGPPAIASEPANQTAVEGSNVVLSVIAYGNVPLAFQWSFNGTTLSGATNSSLTLTNLHPNQTGNYQVIITNSYGAVTSSIATVTVVSQTILAYNYSGNEKVTTAGVEAAYNYSGQLFFIPASTNGTFVGWGNIYGKKQYWVSPFSGYLLITIPGNTNHVYTVLGEAGQEIDADGFPHLWAYLHHGLNAPLAVGTKQTFSFPDIFVCNETHVYPDSKTSNMVLTEADSTYTFAAATTQTANNKGQTMADLVNTLINKLVKQGYQEQ